jgi:hypothetical protein
MAELAKIYHENLQHAGINNKNEMEHEAQIEKALIFLPEKQLIKDPAQTKMFWEVKNTQVKRAIKLSKNGSSTGIDRCPYELWKALNNKHQTNTRKHKPSFNIIKTMTIVFQDIQTMESVMTQNSH